MNSPFMSGFLLKSYRAFIMGFEQLKALFGQRLRRLRKASGLTQGILAEQAGISEEYLSKIERGLASPSFDVISRLCVGLNASPVELFSVYDAQWTAEDPVGPLLVAETAMSMVFEPSPVGFFVSTPQGQLRLASDSLARLFGYDSGEDMQRSVRNLATDVYLDSRERDEMLSRLPSDGSMASLTITGRHKVSGEPVPVQLFFRNYTGREQDQLITGFVLPANGS